MPSLDRTTIIAGPCIVIFGGQTFWSKGDVTFNPNYTAFDVSTSRFGVVDSRFSNKQIEVSFEPDGRFNAALALVLWPYAAMDIGASLYGAVDSPLVVHGRDGVKVTVHNAAITTMPSIRLGVAQTLQGSCTFIGLLANEADPTDADAYYTIGAAGFPGDTGWSGADIKTLAYQSAWGVAPWDDFLTEAGWEIGLDLQTATQQVDGLGVVTSTLQGLTVTARCIPVGPSFAELMAAMDGNLALGASISANASDLVISAAGVHCTIYQAAIRQTDAGWGTQRKRLGATTWQASRTVTGGAVDPLFRISTAAPED